VLDTAWPGVQVPTRLISGQDSTPTPDSRLTLDASCAPFSQRPPPRLIHRRSLRRLGSPPARAIPEARLHHQRSAAPSGTIFYIACSRHVRGARISAFFDRALRAGARPGQDLPEDEIKQSNCHDRRSVRHPLSTSGCCSVERARVAGAWTVRSCASKAVRVPVGLGRLSMAVGWGRPASVCCGCWSGGLAIRRRGWLGGRFRRRARPWSGSAKGFPATGCLGHGARHGVVYRLRSWHRRTRAPSRCG